MINISHGHLPFAGLCHFFLQIIAFLSTIHWLTWTLWLLLYMSGFASLVAVILESLYSKMRCIIWNGTPAFVGVLLTILTTLSQFWGILDLTAKVFWYWLMNFRWNVLSYMYIHNFWSEHFIFPTSSRVKATWRPTGWKERKIYRSRPRQSCATAVNRKTLRTRALMGE